eukprot:6380729-Amphidinium_carterae.1
MKAQTRGRCLGSSIKVKPLTHHDLLAHGRYQCPLRERPLWLLTIGRDSASAQKLVQACHGKLAAVEANTQAARKATFWQRWHPNRKAVQPVMTC